MTDNRVDDLLNADPEGLESEDKAIETLRLLTKEHGAESRAADEVARQVLRGQFRYCPGLSWLEWTGGKWDTDEAATERVHEVIRQFVDITERDYRAQAAEFAERFEALSAAVLKRVPKEEYFDHKRGKPRSEEELIDEYASKEEREEIEKAKSNHGLARLQADMWLNMLSHSKIKSLAALCRGMDRILTRTNSFDAHPDLLNCANGVVDLRTGKLSPHDPELLLTHIAGGAYDPEATSTTWEQALEAVPEDERAWFQVRMGQSITGHSSENDALVLVLGGGENGKSALMSAALRACGSYGQPMSSRILLTQPGQHPTELMDLRGLRFALLEETPEEGRLDTHQLKTIVGTPKITARRMRKDPVTFHATHTLWVNSNHLPQVDTTDHGTWRRLKAMSFPYRYLKPGQEPQHENDRIGDTTLKTRIQQDDNLPEAALAWLVRGAMTWYADGSSLPDPERVTAATEAWRQGSDVGYQFASEHLVADPNSFIPAKVMFREFTAFLEDQGKRAWSAQTINARLGESMAAAGISDVKPPTTPCKVRQGDHASVRRWQGVTSGTSYAPGDVVRAWRGVRFQSDQERREGATGMRVVS